MRRLALLLALAESLLAAADTRNIDFTALEPVAIEELQAINAPGAVIGIVHGGRLVYSKGFGVASVETGAPVTPEMLFRLGSTTKMLTAAAVAILADEGKLRLDEPIGRWVPGLHPRIARLTLHQALSHTAGLRDEAQMFGLHDDAALGAFVRSWTDDFFFTDPGRVYSYSNPGYHLAGFALEVVSGKPYADAMRERLFDPIGMTRTTLRPLVAMTYPLAQGHEAQGREKPAVIRPAADNAGNWPAGSVFSRVEDFSRFVIAFLNGGRIDGRQVLPASVITMLSTPRVDVPASGQKYGYGLSLRHYRGVRFVEHGGARAGYGSFVALAPDHGFGAIVLVNRTGATLPKTFEKALELALTLEPKPETAPQTAMALSDSERSGLMGVYANGESRVEIHNQNGTLYLRSGARNQPIRKIAAGRFAVTSPGSERGQEYAFTSDARGRVEFLHAGGRSLSRVETGK